MPNRIQLFISSVRPSRIGDQIAGWIAEVAKAAPQLKIELIDLRDWPLPMDDEPLQPKREGMESYASEHTRAFSRKVREAEGFIFLLPQYNWGYPAALKNALDHLYYEWEYKPSVIVTYGSRGGGKAADQLAQVMQGVHLVPVEPRVELPLKELSYTSEGRLADPASDFAGQAPVLAEALAALAAALE